ncbi:PAS domain-containing protein [Methylobacterium trifolii]|nr:PAS domain-containing protein [Methylobacterium trifolii]
MADPALRAAGVVGIWDTDVPAGRSVLDAGAAALMAGDPRLAGQPLPMEIALGRLHPDDRGWVFGQIRRVRRTGGPFAAEFRVLDPAGNVRWVLNRGCLAPDETGAMRGLGAYIDTTDAHRGPFLPAAASDGPAADPLAEAADHAMRAHAAIVRSENARLRLLVDMLLLETGRTLARRRHP